MVGMDINEYREEVIQRYVAELDGILKNGTDGDYTASGFVSALVSELDQVDQVALNMPPKKNFLKSYGDYYWDYEYPEVDDWYPEDEYEYDLDEADYPYDFR